MTSPRNEILVNIDPLKNNESAIISGQWKLLQNVSNSNWCPLYGYDAYHGDDDLELLDIVLFDLENDPNERINLASNNSDIVKQLQSKIDSYYETMVPPQNKDPDPNAQDLIVGAGFWYSWQDNNTIHQNVVTVNQQ